MKRGNKRFLKDSIVVLILLSIVFIIPSFSQKTISGTIINPLSLSKTNFAPNEHLSGTLKVKFNNGDLIPQNAIMEFVFQSPKCPKYFFCNDSATGFILWCNYTGEGECECIDTLTIEERCGVTVPLNCEDTNLPVNSFCCEQRGNLGLGDYYQNLVCGEGNCWANCQAKKEVSLLSLIEYSNEPSYGNYTEGKYKNADGVDPPGSGPGFAYCDLGPQTIPLFFKGIITGFTAPGPSPQACIDYDGDEPYISSYCVDKFGTHYDSCSIQVKGFLNEYVCEKDLCEIVQYNCPYGCEAGKCIQQIQQSRCSDTDADIIHPDGVNYYVKGTCTDGDGKGVYTDHCSLLGGGILVEYSCPVGETKCIVENFPCPYGCEAGEGRCKSQQFGEEKPDLLVDKIYMNSEKKLMTSISNIGDRNAGSFVICAYFYPQIQVTCFDEVEVRGLVHKGSIEVELQNPGVGGKTVVVVADYYDEVKESNEENNMKTKYFEPTITCSCTDGGFNVLTKGSCSDGISSPGINEDECYRDGITLKEWECVPSIIPGQEKICNYREFNCVENGYDRCEAGACVPTQYADCEDSDGGKNYYVYGTCIDNQNSYQDSCQNETLTEYYCSVLSPGNPALCNEITYECEFGCESGACKESRYKCDGWNNVYNIDLAVLPLYAPPGEGNYNLNTNLTYLNISLYGSIIYFDVNEQTQQTSPAQTYKSCQNQECILVQGSGSDECSNNADCQYISQSQQTSLSCINYIEMNECISASCYWYDNSCHTYTLIKSTLAPSGPINLEEINIEEAIKGIAWWTWLIIGIILVLIIFFFIIKKVIPLSGKSSKEEKTELRKKYPALIAYINRAKDKGMLREQLRAKLEDKGWPLGVINRAINEFW